MGGDLRAQIGRRQHFYISAPTEDPGHDLADTADGEVQITTTVGTFAEALCLMPERFAHPGRGGRVEVQVDRYVGVVHHAPGAGQHAVRLKSRRNGVGVCEQFSLFNALDLKGADGITEVVKADQIGTRSVSHNLDDIGGHIALGQFAVRGAVPHADNAPIGPGTGDGFQGGDVAIPQWASANLLAHSGDMAGDGMIGQAGGEFVEGGHNMGVMFIAVVGEEARGKEDSDGLIQVETNGGEIGGAVDTEATVSLPDGDAHLVERFQVAIDRAAGDAAGRGEFGDTQTLRGVIEPALDSLESGGLALDAIFFGRHEDSGFRPQETERVGAK
jgi:hypothetical protein